MRLALQPSSGSGEGGGKGVGKANGGGSCGSGHSHGHGNACSSSNGLSLPRSWYGEKDIILLLSKVKIMIVLILSYD